MADALEKNAVVVRDGLELMTNRGPARQNMPASVTRTPAGGEVNQSSHRRPEQRPEGKCRRMATAGWMSCFRRPSRSQRRSPDD